MKLGEEALRLWQIAQTLAISGYHHVFRVILVQIDGPDAVMEQQIARLLAQRLLRHLDFDVRVEGAEKVEGLKRYAIASTHASYLDWAILIGHFPTQLRFVAKRELIWMPVIGQWLARRAILIDRRKGRTAKEAIRTAARDSEPWPILIFPEGTRSPDGTIQPFKAGGLRILFEEGRTVVPVCIRGTFDHFPRHARTIKTGGVLRMLICDPVRADFGGGVDGAMAEVERRMRAAAAQT
ncbi:MAG: 1-acyl-sn-glycerol-3-phosphate acyltransferase [Deltaproteobacteria bacterium]|nr:1-acyl-sn-glycerol-3-phosphate acyltransferase [Deltaproteobacteria bacterium]